jgi:hypothetical protein
MSESDPFRDLLDANVARLNAAAYFADIALVPFVADTTEDELAKRLGVLKGKSGKVGACILAMLPEVDVETPNVPGPQLVVKQSFLVLVHPELNAGSIGTQKPAGAIAREVVRLFHHAKTAHLVQTWNARAGAIVPNTEYRKFSAYTVAVSAEWAQDVPPRCATPSGTLTPTDPAILTLACATSGATLWYTLDGSYPSSANPAATLYAGPFEVAAACILSVAAEKSGLQQSSLRTLSIA